MFHPPLEMRQAVIYGNAVALLPDKEWDEGYVSQGVIAGDVGPTGHLSVQGHEVFPKFFSCLLRLVSVPDLTGRLLESGVAEVDPDPHPGPLSQLFGHERELGVFLFEVFVDDGRFINDHLSVKKDWYFPVWV